MDPFGPSGVTGATLLLHVPTRNRCQEDIAMKLALAAPSSNRVHRRVLGTCRQAQ